jgi:hypothetical protein
MAMKNNHSKLRVTLLLILFSLVCNAESLSLDWYLGKYQTVGVPFSIDCKTINRCEFGSIDGGGQLVVFIADQKPKKLKNLKMINADLQRLQMKVANLPSAFESQAEGHGLRRVEMLILSEKQFDECIDLTARVGDSMLVPNFLMCAIRNSQNSVDRYFLMNSLSPTCLGNYFCRFTYFPVKKMSP